MQTISQVLRDTIAKKKLTFGGAADAVGVAPMSLRRAIRGGRVNGPTLAKYAKFTGFSTTSLDLMQKNTRAKPAKPAKAPAAVKSRPMDFQAIGKLIKAAEGLLSDPLACAVHTMPKSKRAALAAIVQSLS